MCGSYGTQRLTWAEITELARLTTNEPLPPFPEADRFPMGKKAKGVSDWNRSPIIRERNGVREAADAVWGLVPMWWSKPLADKGFDTFNARTEGVAEAKSYRHALKGQRCLIPASRFYESTGPKGGKVRHAITLAGGGPMLLMGLWDFNRTHELLTYTILTTAPGLRFSRFHNRVPAIAPTAEVVEAFFAGDVDQALALAQRSNDELLAVDPPEPAKAA